MVTRDQEPKRRNRKPVGERRISIGFASDTYERILDLADSKGVSVAQVVREAVAGHLERLKTGRKDSL
jgi:predicted DNA-binding protein